MVQIPLAGMEINILVLGCLHVISLLLLYALIDTKLFCLQILKL